MLITDLRPGGSPLRICRLARALSKVNVEPVVGSLGPRAPLHDLLEQWGIQTFSCDASSARDIGALRRLGRVIDSTRPDVIHATLFHANVAARICNRGRRPLITSTVTIEIERRWHNWLESLSMGLSDVHVANSNSVAEHLLRRVGIDEKKIRVIPNGVDLEAIDAVPAINRKEFGIPGDVPLIVWAGRLDPIKNLPVLVDAIDLVQKETRVFAAIVGDGPQRGRIEELIKRRGLNDVRLIGWSSNSIGWMKSADALLFPSRTEGSSNVILEAMACGCPIVASDIDSCRELIGTTRGLLIRVDDVRGFANTVIKALKDTEKTRRMRDAARTYVEGFHRLDVVSGLWKDLYIDIVDLKL